MLNLTMGRTDNSLHKEKKARVQGRIAEVWFTVRGHTIGFNT